MYRRCPLALTLLLFILSPAPAAAQHDFMSAGLTTPKERADFLDTLVAAHQEFRDRESEVLLAYGYGSSEHRALQQKIRARDSVLLLAVKDYLDHYGFPPEPRKEQPRLDSAQAFFMDRLRALPRQDSASIDSLVKKIILELPAPTQNAVRFRDKRSALLLILGIDADFNSRCEMAGFLLPLYDNGELTLLQMLVYLRRTYQIRYGRELDIPTGTTEQERLLMYRRELSGCQ